MALGALESDAEEYLTHVLHALLVPTDITVPCHWGIVSNRSSGSQNFADELVIRLIGLNGLPDPLVEGVGVRAMTVIPALVSQDGCPFSGKKVCVAASFQQLVDELRTLGGRVISEKILSFLQREGRRPAMSTVTRRRKVPSSQGSEGGSPRVCNLAKMCVSMRLRGAGMFSTGTPRGTVARNTVISSLNRTMTDAVPLLLLSVTSPRRSTSAMLSSLDS